MPLRYFCFLCFSCFVLAGCQDHEGSAVPVMPAVDNKEMASSVSGEKPVITYYAVYQAAPNPSLSVYAKSSVSGEIVEEVTGLNFIAPFQSDGHEELLYLHVECIEDVLVEVDDIAALGEPGNVKAIIHPTKTLSTTAFTKLRESKLSDAICKEIADSRFSMVSISVKLLGESSSRSIALPLDGTPKQY